ncbi:hypothetical protein ElP_62240 [Tautonia plasticadhaerens]|uniref:Uncharacterized protein n=1 Tax=Tautonia plasticadhaerens TaxID=2527974 RepID=A0A518HBN5_9BACT|nr:hypothetical protein ElP_62240 [Tautonia plasticadhaerens]
MNPDVVTKIVSAISVGLFFLTVVVTLILPMAYGLIGRRP